MNAYVNDQVKIRPVTPTIGAVIEGIDLTQTLTEEQQQNIEQALLKHQVIFFKNQKLNPKQHADFARQFGELHIHPIYPNIAEQPEIMLLDTQLNDLRDNALWHTDVTFLQTPAKGAILAAKKVPSYGGDTLWVNATAAFASLSQAMQQFLVGLTAQHDIAQSFPIERFGQDPVELEKLAQAKLKYPPISHPVVRTHPVTGQPALFVSEGFTTRINELESKESAAVLNLLFAHLQKPEFMVRWSWQNNDVAFWDNRCTLHYAVDDYRPQHRVMHRATLIGDRPYY
ncbi:taurine dioxygenase [Acinetobacter rudis]|uniref:Taurine dioxygenase n=1 Tax=Acinetobacter rudis TaxID=632955 RepID=A0AAW8JCY0_9GAMM|nr:taurine dioxygenase [Acinetobacter rudis]MDQ8936460.1 taurine dioxygenase [Acinetobacter rudis]MDQ8952456.1 taurine dioxygenase [Acinetobacter rudis]MDQ9018770.1 taurine dioxygenase [Acinetobacter rudis]